jgi:hypothetical protein
MKRAVFLALLLLPITGPAIAAESHITGVRCIGNGDGDPDYISEEEWEFPIIWDDCASCRREMNERLIRHVLDLLNAKDLQPGKSCAEQFPGAGVYFRQIIGCRVTLQTSRAISVECSDEGYTAGRGATNFSSLIFLVDRGRQRVTPVASKDLFVPSSLDAVREALARIIRADWEKAQAGEDVDPNAQISEEEIPGLADEMLETASLDSFGIRFLALGSHHSVFETKFAYAALHEWLSKDALTALDPRH